METKINDACVKVTDQIGIGRGITKMPMTIRLYRDGSLVVPWSLLIGNRVLQRDYDDRPQVF